MTPHFIISFKIQSQSQGRKLYKNIPKQAKLLFQGINEVVRVYNSYIQMENRAKIFNTKVNVVFINMIFSFFYFSSLYEQYHVTSVPSLCQWYSNLYKPFCQLVTIHSFFAPFLFHHCFMRCYLLVVVKGITATRSHVSVLSIVFELLNLQTIILN